MSEEAKKPSNWRKEAKKLIQQAENEGRELTKKEKKYLRDLKKAEKELHRSQRLEKKQEQKRRKSQSKRLIRQYKSDYEDKQTRLMDQWQRELKEAKAQAKQENRSLSKLEKKALRARKKELLTQIKVDYKSQRVSLKLEIQQEKLSHREARKSLRIEGKREKAKKQLQQKQKYEQLEDGYLEKWQAEVTRMHQRAEEEGRELDPQEKKGLIHLRKRYLRECRENWKSQRLEVKTKEKEKKKKRREEDRKIRQKLDEPDPNKQMILLCSAGAVVLLLAFFLILSPSRKAHKKYLRHKIAKKNNTKVLFKNTASPKPKVQKLVPKANLWAEMLARAGSLEKEARYGEALALLSRVIREAKDTVEAQKARQQKDWIVELAKEEYDDLEMTARGKADLYNVEEAKKVLLPVVKKWKIKSYTQRALQLIKTLSVKKIIQVKSPPIPKKILAEIASLERQFDFEKALDLWKEAVKKYAVSFLIQRFRSLELLGQNLLLARFIHKVRQKNLLFPQLAYSAEKMGKVVLAREGMVFVKFGHSQIGIEYSALSAKKIIHLFRWKGATAKDNLYLGLLAYRLGLKQKAHSFWIRALKQQPSLQKKIFRYLAYKKGISLSKEGFVIYKHLLLTLEERALVKEKETIASQIKILFAKHGKKKDRELALGYLRGLAPPLGSYAALVLQQEQKKLLKTYEKKLKKFKKLRALKHELNRRRKEALKRIFDESKYYKKKNDQVVGQDWVDEAVNLVRELWKNPFKTLTRLSPSFKKLAAKLALLNGLIKKLGGKSGLDGEMERIVHQATSRLSLQMISLNDREARLLKYNLRVLKENEKLAGQIHVQEARQILITNQYRVMMGLHALKINTALARAARKHSKEMKVKGYFEHTSPNPQYRTPSKRAKMEGYKKGLVGENIYMGSSSPLAAHKGWYGSPPHHRNILYGDYEDLGVGDYMDHWTQNFGGTGKFKLP